MKPANFCPQCGTQLQDTEIFGRIRRACPACDYIHFNDPKVAAATFIKGNGKILLIKRAVSPEKGKWALPAGFVDYGEDPQQTAIRETLEETGLTIEIMNLVDVMMTESYHKVIVIIYAAQVTGGTLTPDDDAEDARWFGPDEIPELAFESTEIIVSQWVREQQSRS